MSEDICFLCSDNIATVTFGNCQHRLTCHGCYDTLRTSSRGRTRCPQCKELITFVGNTTTVQLGPTTVSDAITCSDAFHQDYPFGSLLFGNQRITGDANILDIVQEAMRMERASLLTFDQLKLALYSKLSPLEIQLVFVELSRDADWHDVLKKIDSRRFETTTVTRLVESVVVRTVEGVDDTAIWSRAVVGSVGAEGIGVATHGWKSLVHFHAGMEVATNTIMCCLFSVFEVYLWSKSQQTQDPMSVGTLVTNIGEHVAGGSGAALGSWMGVAAGAAMGGVFGAVLGLIFLGAGGDFVMRKAYRKIFPREEVERELSEEEYERPLTRDEYAQKAADKFHINFSYNSFGEAQSRYRKMLLANHPDKCPPNAPDEEKKRREEETRIILSCWAIVRGHYEHIGKLDNSVEEGFIKACVLKVYDVVADVWRVKRSWFGSEDQYTAVGETERVETVDLYL